MKTRRFFIVIVSVMLAIGLFGCGNYQLNIENTNDIPKTESIRTMEENVTTNATTAITMITTKQNQVTTAVTTMISAKASEEVKETTEMTKTENSDIEEGEPFVTAEEVNPKDKYDLDSLPFFESGVDLQGEDSEMNYYFAEEGDGWFLIAEKLNVDIDDLLYVNHSEITDMILLGEAIKIPNEATLENASISCENGKIHVLQHGETWWSISQRYQVALGDLLEANGLQTTDWRESGFEVKIPDYGLDADVTEDSINSGTVLGSVTFYSTPGTNSWYNIKLSAAAINGLVLNSGEEFNWFQTPGLGPCGEAEGYLESTAYNGNQVVKAYGGGVCLTSTALYQVAKKAGMSNFEHYDHSLPVTYAARGEEAAINWPNKNNRFTNLTGYTVQFFCVIDDYTGSLTINCIRK